MRNELAIKIKFLEREVRELKNAGRQSGLLKCYSYKVERIIGTHFKVVYADGTQPIISEFYFNGTIMPYQPNQNTNEQLFRAYYQAFFPLTVVATRPIIRVEMLDVDSNS